MKYKGYEIQPTQWPKIYWRKNRKKAIAKSYICLDTETSHNHNPDAPQCWVYQWAFTFAGGIYYGRKPSDLMEKLKELIKHYGCDEKHKILLFVHNLPYDFSYLCLFFRDAFGDPVNVLAHAPRKPFSIQYECGLELRCSFKLANDSLARWGKKLNIRYRKMSGAIDYNIIRHQDSPLYRNDWRYMFTDCIAMDCSIKEQLKLYNDDIASLPLTSTGYPRRDIFRSYNDANGKDHKHKNRERQKFKDTALTVPSYLACYDEFSGGITHGNRYYKGIIQKGNIRHRDFRSHYPTQLHRPMPMSKFNKLTDRCKFSDLTPYAKEYAILCHVVFDDIRLRDKSITLPYLQTSHCMRKHTAGARLLDDNGRVVALKGQCELWLDYNELLIVREQYKMAYFCILETYASKYGELPRWLTDAIDARFKGKSDKSKLLKDYEKAGAERDIILQLKLDLMKDKNMLNGIYGVAATNPVREDIKLTSDNWERIKPDMESIEEKLAQYYKSFKHCMRYQWGIYCTIFARLQLMQVYKIIGADNFIYADTDSIFYYSTPDIEAKLDAYNEQCKKWAMDHGAYITMDDGTIVNYNAFTDEGEDITDFKFLHSKCYAYITSDGKLHCTIAGVKEYDAETKTFREDELGSLDELKDGKIFTKCGGTIATYTPPVGMVYDYYGNETGGGCIISRTTKTLTEENWAEVEHAYLVQND